VEVVEIEPLLPFRFEDLPVAEQEFAAWQRQRDPLFIDRVPATRNALEAFSQAVQAFLESRNAGEPVISRVDAERPEEFFVRVRPAKLPPVIAEVHFKGNDAIATQPLRTALAGVAIGVPYAEPRLRQLLDTSLRPLYEARGRLRVAFPKVETAPAKGVDGLAVTVTVDEGKVYELGDVRLDGPPGLPVNDLFKQGKFKTGEIANFQEIDEAVARVQAALRRAGYIRATVTPRRRMDDAKLAVHLDLAVAVGERYSFGKLTIQGLDIHGEAAIRKMWGMKEEATFNPEYPDYFLNRVKEDGVFDNLSAVRSEATVREATRMVDVTLLFGKPAERKSPLRADPPPVPAEPPMP